MKVVFLGVNWPQYFSGYHRPVINFDMPSRNPTFAELAGCIQEQINFYAEGLYSDKEAKIFDDYCEELLKTPGKRCFDKPYTDRNVWRQWQRASLKDYGDDCMPQMYFSLGNPKTVSGIQFLD